MTILTPEYVIERWNELMRDGRNPGGQDQETIRLRNYLINLGLSDSVYGDNHERDDSSDRFIVPDAAIAQIRHSELSAESVLEEPDD